MPKQILQDLKSISTRFHYCRYTVNVVEHTHGPDRAGESLCIQSSKTADAHTEIILTHSVCVCVCLCVYVCMCVCV